MLSYTIWKLALCFIITWMYVAKEGRTISLAFLLKVKNMTFKIKNTRRITFIRLKACCAKKNKSPNGILVSNHSYDIRD